MIASFVEQFQFMRLSRFQNDRGFDLNILCNFLLNGGFVNNATIVIMAPITLEIAQQLEMGQRCKSICFNRLYRCFSELFNTYWISDEYICLFRGRIPFLRFHESRSCFQPSLFSWNCTFGILVLGLVLIW